MEHLMISFQKTLWRISFRSRGTGAVHFGERYRPVCSDQILGPDLQGHGKQEIEVEWNNSTHRGEETPSTYLVGHLKGLELHL